ncbi:MAG: sugar ABC transporter ATP-binding protein [Oscillospiraceae bacterium]|jgi:ABC-type sugar transport system ATPase subunit
MQQSAVLTVTSLTKQYPGVTALDRVDFDLLSGEVHILLGENGAGKSTLAKCILGACIPDSGSLSIAGEKTVLKTPRDALTRGIVAVYQEFTLVPYLSVAQNIFLNREYKKRNGLLDLRKMEQKAKELLALLDCSFIDVKAPVKSLKVAEQQMVEVAKALSYEPRILIFDEPTATLSEREVACLFAQIRKLKAMGVGIIYISHKIQEFTQIGDRISVFRDGRKLGTYGIHEKSTAALVDLMVGHSVSQTYHRSENPYTEEVLCAEHLRDSAGRVRDVSLTLHKGEILGLAGLVGAGRTELANLLFGIDRMTKGSLVLHGQPVNGHITPRRMVKKGMGFVCEDRRHSGLSIKESVAQNITAVQMERLFPSGVLSQRRVDRTASVWRDRLRIATQNLHTICAYLSGGNQQKVVLGKWLCADAEILILDEPTRGIDVGAKLELYALMDRLATEGKSILLISSELPELVGMSDRILVMREGKVVGNCARGTEEFSMERVGAMMLGIDATETGGTAV